MSLLSQLRQQQLICPLAWNIGGPSVYAAQLERPKQELSGSKIHLTK